MEQPPNRCQQKRPGAGFPEDGVAARVERGLGLIRRVARHDHHDDVPSRGVRSKFSAEIQTIHDGHIDVGHNDIWGGVAYSVQRLDPVIGCEDFHAGAMQKAPVDLPDVGSVIDDEDPWSHARPTVHRPRGSSHSAERIPEALAASVHY
jgi:hypothetical protein